MNRLRSPGQRAAAFLTAFAAVALLAYLLGGFDWLDFDAVAGTAVGTLGLAFFTYALASSTREAGEHSRSLAEASQKQLGLAGQSLSAAQQQVEAGRQAATEAARARIDATAPVVGLKVWQSETLVLDAGWQSEWIEGEPTTLGEQVWFEAQLADVRFQTALNLELQNYGRMPAQISFPSLDPDPEGVVVQTGGSRHLVLPPGEVYVDRMVLRLRGEDAVRDRACHIVVTYNGPITGGMFDTLRWRGTLRLLRLEGGQAWKHHIPLDAGPAQVVREYPALERPEEIQAAIERFRSG